MKFSALLISALALTLASPAFAAPAIGRGPSPSNLMFDHGQANAIAGRPQNLENALVLLRTEAIAMQASDGGTLTAAHRDYLQIKLDRLAGKRLGTLRDL